MRTRTLGWVLTAGFWLSTTALWAGPPFETDDPEPVDYGHWEIFLGTTINNTKAGSQGTLPFVEFNYGVLPDTHISVQQQLSFNSPQGLSGGYGYGDIQAGVKFRFLHETPDLPQAAVYPQINIPAGDAFKGLGSGQDQFLLPLWIQKSWGPWTTFGGGGYWINPGPGNRNWIFLGWVLQRDLSPFLTLGGEVFYHGSNAIGTPDGAGFNLGGYLNFDDLNHLVVSAGRDFINSTYTFTGFFAYQCTF